MIEIARDVKLEKHGRVIAGPARCSSLYSFKTRFDQIESVHEDINNAHRIIFANEVLKALQQQGHLPRGKYTCGSDGRSNERPVYRSSIQQLQR
ncbi:hypothetical protein SAMN04515617_10633 [Collimonas sp. OK242]|nr:hypothetical protein SAMN04515617_10633 [Collimonas sp. OK242]